MKHIILQNKIKEMRERGFSLIEILVAVLIVGLLAAIAIPIFVNQQKEATAAQYKNDLITAAFLIEQEAIDNNGLYPTYLPQEVKNNSRTKTFTYSYANDRTSFCLQATSPVGKFFVDSSNTAKVVTTDCTDDIIAKGNVMPWKDLVFPVIPQPVSAKITWTGTESAAKAAASIPSTTCSWDDATEQSTWGSKLSVQTRFIYTNYDRGGTVMYSAWSATPSATTTLTDWLPYERVGVQAQIKCVVSQGTDYAYLSKPSSAETETIPAFKIDAPSHTATATWRSTQKMSISARWSEFTCPVGTKKYDFDFISTTTGDYLGGTTPDADEYEWATSYNRTSTEVAFGDGKITTVLTYKCQLPDGGKTISSPKDTVYSEDGLYPPGPPAGLTGNYSEGQPISPSNYTWNEVNCVVGTPQSRLVRTAPESWTGQWLTSRKSTPTQAAGTTYTYVNQARCVSDDAVSKVSIDSAPLTVTATAVPPVTPETPTSFRAASSPTTDVTHDSLYWNPVTCPYDYGTPQYQLTRSKPTSATLVNWTTETSYQMPSSPVVDTVYTYSVRARCVDNGLVSASSPVATVTYTGTAIAPRVLTAPANFRSDGNGGTAISPDRLLWDAATCSGSGSPRYQIIQNMKDGRVLTTAIESSWITGRTFNIDIENSNKGSRLGFRIATRCVSTTAGTGPETVSTTTYAFYTQNTDTGPVQNLSITNAGAATWNAPSIACGQGETMEYQVTNHTVTWYSGWSTSRSVAIKNWTAGKTYKVEVNSRCAGPPMAQAQQQFGLYGSVIVNKTI